MQGYTHKKCRRYGVKLCQREKCPVTRRNYPPGVHGQKRQKRLTEYGLQLAEKQKTKIIYNLLEKQFRNYFEKAVKKQGDTGENLIRLLELRLDNVIYRLGLAKTRRQARQLVNHAHFSVNNKKVNIPSYQVKAGDVIAIREKSLKSPLIKENIESIKQENIPHWLNWDVKSSTGKVIKDPVTDNLKKSINTKIIIEFYSR